MAPNLQKPLTPILEALLPVWVMLRYVKKVRRLPHVFNPTGFNDHITRRMLFDRTPLLKAACDKVEAKRLVAERLGPEYVVPVLGVWSRAEDIDWDTLPAEYVLKPSFTSGPFKLVDRSRDQPEQLSAMADSWLNAPLPIRHFCEWGHHGLPRRVLAEPLLRGPRGGALTEWFVFVFGGQAKLVRAMTGTKLTSERRDAWFDREGRQLDIGSPKIVSERRTADLDLLREVLDLSERVSVGFQSLRVDLYETERGIMVGELSPYSWGGSLKWSNRQHDQLIGSLFTPGTDTSLFESYRD